MVEFITILFSFLKDFESELSREEIQERYLTINDFKKHFFNYRIALLPIRNNTDVGTKGDKSYTNYFELCNEAKTKINSYYNHLTNHIHYFFPKQANRILFLSNKLSTELAEAFHIPYKNKDIRENIIFGHMPNYPDYLKEKLDEIENEIKKLKELAIEEDSVTFKLQKVIRRFRFYFGKAWKK